MWRCSAISHSSANRCREHKAILVLIDVESTKLTWPNREGSFALQHFDPVAIKCERADYRVREYVRCESTDLSANQPSIVTVWSA
nr:hypothetical protein HmN_000680600 [Hymenolepis microstoma]